MDNHATGQSEWRATIIVLVATGIALGVEQTLPLSDALRSQIGVLTVLLMSGLWHLLFGLLPGDKRG